MCWNNSHTHPQNYYNGLKKKNLALKPTSRLCIAVISYTKNHTPRPSQPHSSDPYYGYNYTK